MARIIAITNQKGGVGKTTTSVNLSACVAAQGKRVLVVDADPQGNTSSGLGVRVKEKTPTVYEVLAGETPLKDALAKTAVEGLMVLPADIRLAGAEIELAGMEHRERVMTQMLENAKDDFDYIFIDCPPSLGLITLNALCAADGVLIPVTVLQAGPCVVTQIKTVENDGYEAVQVGFVDKKEKVINRDKAGKKEVIHRHGVNKAQKGHFEKAGVSCKRYLKEFRFEDAETYTLGQEIKADIFGAGDKIDATATSKGKGFQGAIKRHGQSRGPMAHGSKYHRHAGSNGACSDPSKVFKGKRMPGQMGGKKITVQNLEIVKVDVENNLLLVKGAVPGPKKSMVTIKETVKCGK